MTPKLSLRLTLDRVGEIGKAISELANRRVMVGIPMDSEKNERTDDAEITNAQIGYLNEFGDPAHNLPARPFLVPGVEGIKDDVQRRLKAVGKDALEGKLSAVDQGLNALGLVGQNAVRQKITDGPFAPLAPATVAARRRAHPSRQAQTAADMTPLIDTGQLRNSIVYVVRKTSK